MNLNCGVSIAKAVLILEDTFQSFSNGNPNVGTLCPIISLICGREHDGVPPSTALVPAVSKSQTAGLVGPYLTELIIGNLKNSRSESAI